MADLKSLEGGAVLAEAIRSDCEEALNHRQRAIQKYAIRLASLEREVYKEEMDELRNAGLSEVEILELIHVVGFFSHINRVAEATGVDLETWMPPRQE